MLAKDEEALMLDLGKLTAGSIFLPVNTCDGLFGLSHYKAVLEIFLKISYGPLQC